MGLLRSLSAAVCASLFAGCGAFDGLGGGPRPALAEAPDGGPPLGGSDVVDWTGDAAVDPEDTGVSDDAALPEEAGVDAGG